jgi:creatinine amidohydrolase/Fe(II)-dependent formamide hydrolase-like protein
MRASLPVDLFGNFEDDRPAGYSGNAADATAEEGAEIITALAGMVVPFLRELDRQDWKRGPWMHQYQPTP